MRHRGIALLFLASCLERRPSPTYGPQPAYPVQPTYPSQPAYPQPYYPPPPAYAPTAYVPVPPTPVTPRAVPVRVLGAQWRGQPPGDERGPWTLDEATNVVRQLSAAAADTGLSFFLEGASALDVTEERFARIPTTQAGAIAAMQAFAWSGRLSNQTLSVVVVSPDRSTWVAGWGQQGHPLRTPGKWPMMLITTRIVRAREAHWIGHELGHVFGFFDSTFYDAAPVDNPPYTQCGLFIPSRTYPRTMAPPGARQNLMSYETEERRSFFSAGYETSHRQILDCWIRSSGL